MELKVDLLPITIGKKNNRRRTKKDYDLQEQRRLAALKETTIPIRCFIGDEEMFFPLTTNNQ